MNTDSRIVEINLLLDSKVTLSANVSVQQSVPAARVLSQKANE